MKDKERKSYIQLLQWGEKRLEEAGIGEAKLDAWYLLSESFSLSRERYLMDRNCSMELSGQNLGQYHNWIEKRSRRIPLQHIIGTQEFMGLTFEVDQRVLIPRQDTEILVQEVLKEKNKTVLDICTGSGCIAVSLACLGHFARIDALDLSVEAIEVAKKNAKRLGASVQFFHSDLLENISQVYDILVSNPPYIPKQIIDGLEPEVKDHEPYIALYGPENGLYFYRRISQEGRKHLKSGGKIYYEIGCDQAEAVCHILEKNGYIHIQVVNDLAGHNRVVIAVKN